MLVKTLVFPHFNYSDVGMSDLTVELTDHPKTERS